MAKWLAAYWPNLELDVVEMDPSVCESGGKLFDYTAPPTHHVSVQDARTFLTSTSAHYDLIWVDVFARHLIPFHVTTQNSMRNSDTFESTGVIAVNLASSNADLDMRRAEAIVATLKTSFPVVKAFNVAGPSWLNTRPGSVNVIFFAGAPVSKMQDPNNFAKP